MFKSCCLLLISLSVISCVPLTSDYEYEAETRNALSLDPDLVERITDFASIFGYVNNFEIVKNIERVSDALNFYLTKDIPYQKIIFTLMNPFQITSLSCGPWTFYDGNSNPTVGLDVCLAGLVIAKLFLAAPLLKEGVQEGGIFNVLDTIARTMERLDLSGTGPEGEPFGPEVDEKKPEIKEIGGVEYEVVSTVQKPAVPLYSQSSYNQDTRSPLEQTQDFQPSPEEIYQGFGFNDWNSGLKKLTELGTMLSSRQGLVSDLPDFTEGNDMELYDYLPRSMPGLPTARLDELLQSTIGGLRAAVTVNYKQN